MIRIENIKIGKDLTKEELISDVCKKKGLDINKIKSWRIFKKSIDARNKKNIYYNYSIDIEVENENDFKDFKKAPEDVSLVINKKNEIHSSPVIIGSGPSGLFAALVLIENGIKPIVIEQGSKIEDRIEDVAKFRKEAILNVNSNVQFGEGGAGTFSDGKLTTGTHDPLIRKVLDEFYRFGAPEEILYMSKPHIGTDKLIEILKKIREYIIAEGGEFLFNTKAVDFIVSNDKIEKIQCEKDGKSFFIETEFLILAIGHSARDTFYKLYDKGFNLERKNFSVGVRIEHKQEMINKSQYGEYTKLKLPNAEYKLSYHGQERSCYTFCMCPGGYVIASTSEENAVVTNGMSEYLRNGKNANSAVLVNVVPEDFEGDNPLAGIEFQRKMEHDAFVLGGSNYYAPVQRVEDFLKNRKSDHIGEVKPTYIPGVTLSNLNDILPEFVSKTIKEALVKFDKEIKGFASPDAILTGVETRSSSPVRILRSKENMMSNIKNVFPIGEGAGYAGGITTAAVDGIKCAVNFLENKQIF